MAETGKSFIKKFVGFSLVTWISFGLSFLTAPISTRLFTPDVQGKINIFNTYSNLFGVFVLLGLDQAYARFFNERPNNKSKGYLLTFCCSITYTFLFLAFVLAIPIRDWLSWQLFQEEDNILLFLLFISVFASSTLRYLNLTYRMDQDIKMFTIQGILNTLFSKVLYLSVGFWNPTYKPALIVLAISHFTLALVFLIIQHGRYERVRRFEKSFANELFKYALPLIPVSVLMWANSSIPQLVMQRTMDYYSIGIFTSAMALANMILIIQSGFNTFWVPYAYENYKTQTGQFFKVYRYLMCALTIFALVLVCSQDLIFLLLGAKYRAAKAFFPFLIMGPVCYIAGEVAGIGIDISKKSFYKLYVFLASITVNLICCVLLRIPLGVAGIALSTSLAAITSLVVTTLIGERYYKVISNYKYLIFCLVSILACAFITLKVSDQTMRSLLNISVLLISVFFFRQEIKELLVVARSFIKRS